MSIEMLNLLSIVSFSAAGLFFLLAIAFFFLLDIPRVFGELSGRTAKRSIKEIEKHNSGNEPGRAGYHKPSSRPGKSGRVGVGTEKFATASLAPKANETTLLDSTNNETTLLDATNNETTLLDSSNNQTTLLQADEGVIEPASSAGEATHEAAANNANAGFTIEEEMSSYLNDEIIE